MNRMGPRIAGQSARAHFRNLFKLAVLLLGGAYLVGLVIAFIFTPNTWLIYAVFSPVVAAAFLLTFQREDVRELISILSGWRKGAIGEEQVGKVLEPLRAQGYTLIHDLDSGRGNIDHVVVGPNGVFIIETKAISGRLWVGRGGKLMRGKFEAEGIPRQARAEAVEVRRCLERIGLQLRVHALVALTHSELPRGPIRLKLVSLIEAKDAVIEILGVKGRVLSTYDIDRAVAAIYRGDQDVRLGA